MPSRPPVPPKGDGPARFRAVLFDVGGTLVETRDFEGYSEIARTLGLNADHEAWSEAVRWAGAEFDRPGAVTFGPGFWGPILARVVGSEVPGALIERFVQALEARPPIALLFSDVLRTLRKLQAEGRVLGVVSNSHSEAWVRRMLETAGILSFFSAVVSSGSEGISKPDPEIFRRGAERLGFAVGETFYIGDLANTDARAADAAGLGSVWLNRDGTGFGEDPPEITSLTELPRWLARLESERRPDAIASRSPHGNP